MVITINLFQEGSRTARWGSVQVAWVKPISHFERIVFVRPFTHPRINNLIYSDSFCWKSLLMLFVNHQSVTGLSWSERPPPVDVTMY